MATPMVRLGPAPLDLTGIRAGDANQITLTLTVAGQPLDLTGLTLAAQARKVVTDTEPALTAQVVVLDAAAGQAMIRWPGEDVRTLLGSSARWSGVWDLEARAGTGDPTTLVAGKLRAQMDVTHE